MMSKPSQIQPSANEFDVAGWHVNASLCTISKDKTVIKIEPKVMDLLVYFAQRPDSVLSREELEREIWRGTIVGYDALSNAIIKLRKAFDDDARHPQFIETVAKRGYRLIASVHTDISEHRSDTPVSLPYKFRPRPIHYSFFTIIVTSAIAITLLTWQFSRAPDTANKSVFISDNIDPEAYDAFVMGWASYRRETPEDYLVALAHFERATVLHPDYGQAHAAIAAIYWRIWQRSWNYEFNITPRSGAWKKAQQSLDKAMRQPTPLAHQIASEMLYTNRRFDEAIVEAEKAIALSPNDPIANIAYANALAANGQSDEAIRLIRKKMHLDPDHSVYFLYALGVAQFNRKNYKQAVVALEQVIRYNALDNRPYLPLIASYGYSDQKQKAAAAIARVNQLRKRFQRPDITVQTPADPWEVWIFRDQEEVTHLQAGLRAAGVREW